jgi:hypothetical protein
MTNNKSPDEKRPGENPEGTFHFNPGNMAGKKPGDTKQSSKSRGSLQEEEREATKKED